MRRAVSLSLVATAAAIAVHPHSLAAQDSLTALTGDRETAAQLRTIVDAARGQGLPPEPIVSKVREGVLFHAAPAKIVAAAQQVAKRLEVAREALAPSPGPADITAGENALSISGVSTDALRAVRAASPNRPVAVPIGVLAQLVASGVPAAKATSIVTELIRRGATAAQLVALGGDVNSDVAGGATAEAALGVRLNGLTPFLPIGAPGQSAISTTMLDAPAPFSTSGTGVTGSGKAPKKP